MSMIALAMRMSATRALESAGATLAGARVYDSAIAPIDEMVSADPLPMIVVSTEEYRGDVDGGNFNSGSRQIQLVIETALSQRVELPDGEGIADVVPPTDAGLELTLAILDRQIAACLFGRGGGSWGNVFRKLMSGTAEVVSRRGIQSKEGARVAARQAVYTVHAIAEPPFGQPLPEFSPLVGFLAAVAGDPQTAALAPVLLEAIEGTPVGWPEVYSVAAMIAGLSDEHGRAIGIAPLEPGGGLAVEATLDPADPSAAWVDDEATIAEQLPEEPGP